MKFPYFLHFSLLILGQRQAVEDWCRNILGVLTAGYCVKTFFSFLLNTDRLILNVDSYFHRMGPSNAMVTFLKRKNSYCNTCKAKHIHNCFLYKLHCVNLLGKICDKSRCQILIDNAVEKLCGIIFQTPQREREASQ